MDAAKELLHNALFTVQVVTRAAVTRTVLFLGIAAMTLIQLDVSLVRRTFPQLISKTESDWSSGPSPALGLTFLLVT